MKREKSTLIICVLIPLAVGAVAGVLSGGGMAKFAMLNKPPLSPPGWVFPIVWTILYLLMGIASYLVLTAGKDSQETGRALIFYAVQLAVNFFWPILFFTFGLYAASFIWLVLLWVLIVTVIYLFGEISQSSAYLLVPYLLWVTFAGYLNLGVWLLN